MVTTAQSSNATIDQLADRGDKVNMRTKKDAPATAPKSGDAVKANAVALQKAHAIALQKAWDRKADSTEEHHAPNRQRNTLNALGPALVELLDELVTDAVDQKKRDVAENLESAISGLHDVIDDAQNALDELGK
jgi:hypothetical protein